MVQFPLSDRRPSSALPSRDHTCPDDGRAHCRPRWHHVGCPTHRPNHAGLSSDVVHLSAWSGPHREMPGVYRALECRRRVPIIGRHPGDGSLIFGERQGDERWARQAPGSRSWPIGSAPGRPCRGAFALGDLPRRLIRRSPQRRSCDELRNSYRSRRYDPARAPIWGEVGVMLERSAE